MVNKLINNSDFLFVLILTAILKWILPNESVLLLFLIIFSVVILSNVFLEKLHLAFKIIVLAIILPTILYLLGMGLEYFGYKNISEALFGWISLVEFFDCLGQELLKIIKN